MGAPKSVVKLRKKNGQVNIEYTSDIDATQYYIHELTRAALRDVSRFLKKTAQANFYGAFKKRTGGAGKAVAINSKVWSSKSTKYPRLEIGLNTKGLEKWFFFQEIGTRNIPRQSILENTAKSNIQTILKIESKYLSELNSDKPNVDITEGDIEE